MSIVTVIVGVAAFAGVGCVLWALTTSQRSIMVVLIAAVVAPMAALVAWYAWAESRDIPWTVGLGAVALASVAAAVRHCGGGGGGGGGAPQGP